MFTLATRFKNNKSSICGRSVSDLETQGEDTDRMRMVYQLVKYLDEIEILFIFFHNHSKK